MSQSETNDKMQEYCNITRELEAIRNNVTVLKELTEERMARAKSEKEKARIYKKFQDKLDTIKKDETVKARYKQLKKRQKELEVELRSMKNISVPDEEIDGYMDLVNKDSDNELVSNQLNNMINRYKTQVDNKITINIGNKKILKIKKNNWIDNSNNINATSASPTDKYRLNSLNTLIESLKMDDD
jgi:hypothetical protein